MDGERRWKLILFLRAVSTPFQPAQMGSGIIKTKSVRAMSKNVVNASQYVGKGRGTKLVGLTSMIPKSLPRSNNHSDGHRNKPSNFLTAWTATSTRNLGAA